VCNVSCIANHIVNSKSKLINQTATAKEITVYGVRVGRVSIGLSLWLEMGIALRASATVRDNVQTSCRIGYGFLWHWLPIFSTLIAADRPISRCINYQPLLTLNKTRLPVLAACLAAVIKMYHNTISGVGAALRRYRSTHKAWSPISVLRDSRITNVV